jgi:hypothetical protein
MKDMAQIAPREEQETHVHIDYEERQIIIYSNRATVCNRICRLGHEPDILEYENGEVYAMTWRLPTSEVGKFMRTGIFKFD